MSWFTVALIPVRTPSGSSSGAPPTWAIALLVVVVLAFPMLILVGSLLQARRRRLDRATNLATGVPMTAKVILLTRHPTAGQTGPYGVTLEVAHPHGAFVVMVSVVVELQSLPQLQIGTMVPVRVAAADNVQITLPGVSHP